MDVHLGICHFLFNPWFSKRKTTKSILFIYLVRESTVLTYGSLGNIPGKEKVWLKTGTYRLHFASMAWVGMCDSDCSKKNVPMHVKKQHSLVLSAVLQMILYKHYTYGSWVTQSTEGQGFHWQKQMLCVTRKGLRTWHGQDSMKRSGKYMLVPAKKKKKVCFKSAAVSASNYLSILIWIWRSERRLFIQN